MSDENLVVQVVVLPEVVEALRRHSGGIWWRDDIFARQLVESWVARRTGDSRLAELAASSRAELSLLTAARERKLREERQLAEHRARWGTFIERLQETVTAVQTRVQQPARERAEQLRRDWGKIIEFAEQRRLVR